MIECSIDDVLRTTARIPFTTNELQFFIEAMKLRRSKGHDLQPGDGFLVTEKNDFVEAASEGLCFAFSPSQLQTRFLFVKCNAGKGLLGGQKSVFNSYIQSFDEPNWLVGPVFKMWSLATTSIGNVYRGNGFGSISDARRSIWRTRQRTGSVVGCVLARTNPRVNGA